MRISSPFEITSRLMAGFRVGGGVVSIEYDTRESSGRTRYRVFIDLPDGTEHEINDLRSGCGGGSIAEGLSSLCSFLSAAAESYSYRMRTGRPGENEDLFPAAIVEWAYQHADEISLFGIELDENPDLIAEE